MKRILVLLLAAALLFPTAVGLGGLFRRTTVFETEDQLREDAISAALKRTEGDSSRSFLRETVKNEGNYIVRFSSDLSDEELLACLEGTNYRLLSASADRVFALTLADAAAFEAAYGDSLLYCCEDRVLTTAAVPSDPYVKKEAAYEQMELLSAWELVTPASEVTVAVLDTGVDRSHEELAGANLLDGYDAVARSAGVYGDTDGHGTAVIGLIAATAENGVGTAGVAYGVTVLPVRVASDANRIYSSDLIGGIRFAADAGADILNLSFGGYTYSAAEYDAVSYALGKGCILIAAAGNDGKTAQSSQPIYPASYEGVISVGSCDADGVLSDFSQDNDTVDLLAPGEDLRILSVDENGNSTYRTDKGTSYSAALVSGVAALALSALEGTVRFTGEELLTLLADSRRRQDSGGYGLVSALTAVQNVNLPMICGVENGRIYSEAVTVTFNRGNATLDGEEFYNGETIYRNGKHILTVTDGDRESTVIFMLSVTPAAYEVEETDTAVRITYRGGSATLDGIPYPSGEEITASGWHLFALTDSLGETQTYCFCCDFAPLAVTGVQDGGVYDDPVLIRVAGTGDAMIDGVPFSEKTVVATDGEHVLTTVCGTERKEYRFVLRTGVKEYENELSRSGVIADETHGWYAIYSEMLTGIRVYDMENGQFRGFFATETVCGYVFADGLLYVFGEWQLTVLDPAQMLDGEPVVASYQIRCQNFAYADGILYCLADGLLYTLSAEDGRMDLLLETDADELYADGSTLWLYSSKANRFDRLQDGALQSFTPDFPAVGKRKLFVGNWLFCGGSAVRLSHPEESFSVSFTFDGYAVGCSEDYLFATDGVYRLSDGILVGQYAETVSCVLTTAGGTYVCGMAGGIRFYPVQDGILSYGFASFGESLLDTPASDGYTTLYRLFGGAVPTAFAADGNDFAAVFAKERILLQMQNGEFKSQTALPFSPVGVALANGRICAWSGDCGLLWLDGNLHHLAWTVKNAFFLQGGLYLQGNGKLYRFADGTLTDTGIAADAACGAGDTLAWCADGQLYIKSGEQTVTVSGNSEHLLTDGNYVVCGKLVYSAQTGTLLNHLGGKVLALYGNMLLTENGLYSLTSRTLLSEFDASDCALAALGGGAGAVFYYGHTLLISRFEHAIAEEPLVIGVPADGLVSGQTTVYYDRGKAFLDGSPFENGTVITEAGTHVLTLVLPCAVVRQYSFTVVPVLEEIAFSTPVYRLAVGERGVLHIKYLPDGTSSVPVTYTAEGDSIRLEADGSFLALHEGETTVTAQTADGMHRAVCRVVVASALLRFEEEAGYTVDRESGIVWGIPTGTAPETLLAQVVTEGRIEITPADTETDASGTGTVLLLYSPEGEELDRLTVATEGDTDGDGYMTLRDLLLLEEWLTDGTSLSEAVTRAADLNGSGNVTDRDANLMREMLLFETGSSRRKTPPTGGIGSPALFLPTVVFDGDTVGVTLYVKNASEVSGASGRLRFDSSCMQYTGFDSYGFAAEVYDGGEWISFLATGEPSGETVAIVTLYFTVTSEDAFELQLSDAVLLEQDRAFGFARETVEVQPKTRIYGELSLSVTGMTEPFSKDRTVYEVLLPAGTPALDYTLQYPENCTVTVKNTVFGCEDTLEAVFTFRPADGERLTYTVRASRGGVRTEFPAAVLDSLTAKEVFIPFDPSVTEYTLTVPYSVSSLTLEWTANDALQINCGNTALNAGKETEIVLTVLSESGESTVYTLRVFRERAEESRQTSHTSVAPNGNGSLWWIPFVILVVGTALIVWMNRKDKKKNG